VHGLKARALLQASLAAGHTEHIRRGIGPKARLGALLGRQHAPEQERKVALATQGRESIELAALDGERCDPDEHRRRRDLRTVAHDLQREVMTLQAHAPRRRHRIAEDEHVVPERVVPIGLAGTEHAFKREDAANDLPAMVAQRAACHRQRPLTLLQRKRIEPDARPIAGHE
jgi:hypothetical protein